MKKLLTAFFFVPLLCFSQTLLQRELLGRPTSNSITIQAFFSDSVQVSIRYGTSSGNYTAQTPWATFMPGEPAEVVVSQLQPNTQYYYSLQYRHPGTVQAINRPEYTFHTQRPAGSGFTFIVQADPHMDEQSDTALYGRCLQNQLEDSPDFMIDLGDFLMTDKLKDNTNTVPHDTIPYRCKLLRSFYEKACHSVPLYIALGNHEGEAGWYLNNTANNIANWDTEERKKYFLNPYPDNFYTGDTTQHPYVGLRENYYAWTWGDALFIVLDPYWYTAPKPDSLHGWRWTLGKAQYDWLKYTLENADAKFKFVFAHQIIGGAPDGRGGVEVADLYEWGGNNLDGTPGFTDNRPGWYKPIKDLLRENRVTIFFHGHDHFFGKQDKDCLVYQETPQPSLPNFQNANMAADYGYFEGQILPNTGHIRVSVDSSGIKVEYVRAYLPQNENGNRHNKDVSATYYIANINCYDSTTTSSPMLWNADYSEDIVYPNPFSQHTTIEFALQQPTPVNLSIYTMQGQLVRHLLQGSTVQPGKFQIVWDGTDDQNHSLPSGNYFYLLQDNSSKSKTGKLIISK